MTGLETIGIMALVLLSIGAIVWAIFTIVRFCEMSDQLKRINEGSWKRASKASERDMEFRTVKRKVKRIEEYLSDEEDFFPAA